MKSLAQKVKPSHYGIDLLLSKARNQIGYRSLNQLYQGMSRIMGGVRILYPEDQRNSTIPLGREIQFHSKGI